MCQYDKTTVELVERQTITYLCECSFCGVGLADHQIRILELLGSNPLPKVHTCVCVYILYVF